jgi:hypothetical protein
VRELGKRRRVPKEFLGAFKHGHRSGVREYIDEEFSYTLLQKSKNGDIQALEALQWITKYNNEVYRGVLKKGDESAIHNSAELYKQASDGHNARRRDLISGLRSGNLGPSFRLYSLDENPLLKAALTQNQNLNHEEVIIEMLSPSTQGRICQLSLKKKLKITTTD